MLQPALLANLRCPEDRSELSPAGQEIVDRLNAAVRRGALRNAAGRLVEKEMDGALIRARGDIAYPIIDHIPLLLREEAVEIGALSAASNGS